MEEWQKYEIEYAERQNNPRNILNRRYGKHHARFTGVIFLTIIYLIPTLFFASTRKFGCIALIVAVGYMIWTAIRMSRINSAINKYDRERFEKIVQLRKAGRSHATN